MIFPNYVILNFDLGIRGEYDSLYTFLDKNKALDCGNSNCAFEYHFKGTDLSFEDKFIQLKKEGANRTAAFKKIGNDVPPLMAKFIGVEILKALKD